MKKNFYSEVTMPEKARRLYHDDESRESKEAYVFISEIIARKTFLMVSIFLISGQKTVCT
jgi:hypothetical protein